MLNKKFLETILMKSFYKLYHFTSLIHLNYTTKMSSPYFINMFKLE